MHYFISIFQVTILGDTVIVCTVTLDVMGSQTPPSDS